MKVKLKPLEEQVVVITGASSGIGLVTARMAAKRGARVVLVSRSKPSLKRAVRAIQKRGGEATYVVADVTDPRELEAVAEAAIRRWGRIDTWVNNAGVAILGNLDETPLDDARQLFEINYWGVVHGSLVALEHLRENGGALINVGSAESDRAIPLQGHYAASKAAVKAFTDALRMELEKEEVPVAVTLVKPSSTDTPLLTRHAKNLMDEKPRYPPPVYTPRVVARAILRCAERATREIGVGSAAPALRAMSSGAPGLTDRVMKTALFAAQKRPEPADPKQRDNLFRPDRHSEQERGDHPGLVLNRSAYTRAALHPVQTVLGMALLGAGAVIALRARNASP